VTVQAVGSDLQFDIELSPNWNIDTGSHYAVAFALATGGLPISGLSYPYFQVTGSTLPVSNPGFPGPFNYALGCDGPGSGQNSCGTQKHNGDLATSLIFDVMGGGSLLPLLEGAGSDAAYITVDIYSPLTGKTGVVGASSFTYVTNILVTPLPATLPLFVSGLAALGLIGNRRRKKASIVVAA
jgi:hypothetical protein